MLDPAQNLFTEEVAVMVTQQQQQQQLRDIKFNGRLCRKADRESNCAGQMGDFPMLYATFRARCIAMLLFGGHYFANQPKPEPEGSISLSLFLRWKSLLL